MPSKETAFIKLKCFFELRFYINNSGYLAFEIQQTFSSNDLSR